VKSTSQSTYGRMERTLFLVIGYHGGTTASPLPIPVQMPSSQLEWDLREGSSAPGTAEPSKDDRWADPFPYLFYPPVTVPLSMAHL